VNGVRLFKFTSEVEQEGEQAQGPHSHILMQGGPTEVHILYPKKINFRICLPKKNPYFFSIPQKIPQCFFISKFYYLSRHLP